MKFKNENMWFDECINISKWYLTAKNESLRYTAFILVSMTA